MHEADELLIEKSLRGDLKSFEALIERYQKRAFNIAFRYLGDYDMASDAAQDAMIKVYKNLKKFKGEASFSTWLYRIVLNTCKDHIRMTKKNVVPLNFDPEHEDREIQLSDESSNPENVSEKKERIEIVQKAISTLPEDYKEMVVLRDIQGFTYEEISDITGVAIGTVKSRIHRARHQLKTTILSSNPDILEMIG